MRIALVHDDTPNAHYRAQVPMAALSARGHVVEPLRELDGRRPPWDAVHLYRLANPWHRETVRRLREQGVAVVYDIDDDLGALAARGIGGFSPGSRRKLRKAFDDSLALGRAASVVTTPSPVIAEVYRAAGVARTAVVENYVLPRRQHAGARHPGLVIGCVAGREHGPDFKRLKIDQALERVLERHPQVRVVTVGVQLRLKHPRYTYRQWIPLDRLIEHGRSFDVGFAPLVDNPFNRARSNVKLKEYAAAGVPWLASPVGPYAGMGEHEGGELVADGDWCDAFLRIVEDYPRRRRLAANARRWSAAQSLSVIGARWESVYRSALATAAGRR